MIAGLVERTYPGSASDLGTSTARAWFYRGTGSADGTWCWDAWHCSGSASATGAGCTSFKVALAAAETFLGRLEMRAFGRRLGSARGGPGGQA